MAVNRFVDPLLRSEIDPRDPLHCPRCGGLHVNRTKYRCTLCSTALCVQETETMPDGGRAHFRHGAQGLSFCGYAVPTSEVLE